MYRLLRFSVGIFWKLAVAGVLVVILSSCSGDDMGHEGEAATGDLDQALTALLGALEQSQSPILPLLAGGRTADDVQGRFSDLGLACPRELLGYFRWRDGLVADRSSDPELFPGANLLSLDEATGLHGQLTAMSTQISAQSGVVAERIWDPRWFPVLAGISSDFYVLVCDDAPGASSAVHLVMVEDPDSRRPVFDSLASMFETVAAAYVAGLYRLDEDGMLQEDRPAVAALVERLNPGIVGDRLRDVDEAGGDSAVAKALDQEDDRRRARALIELVDPDDPGTGDAVVSALSARGDTLRIGVTRVLMDMEDPRAESLFVGLLGDSSWMVRSAAAQGLGQLKSASAVPVLMARLGDNERGVRVKAVWALGEIGDPAAREALTKVLEGGDAALADLARQSLARIDKGS
jgi:cell wall assembly regulator SMI1